MLGFLIWVSTSVVESWERENKLRALFHPTTGWALVQLQHQDSWTPNRLIVSVRIPPQIQFPMSWRSLMLNLWQWLKQKCDPSFGTETCREIIWNWKHWTHLLDSRNPITCLRRLVSPLSKLSLMTVCEVPFKRRLTLPTPMHKNSSSL